MDRNEERARAYYAGDTSHTALIEEIRAALECTGYWEECGSEIRIITRWSETGRSSDGGDYTYFLSLRQVGSEWLVYPDWSASFDPADFLPPGVVYPQAIGHSTMVKIVEKLAQRKE